MWIALTVTAIAIVLGAVGGILAYRAFIRGTTPTPRYRIGCADLTCKIKVAHRHYSKKI